MANTLKKLSVSYQARKRARRAARARIKSGRKPFLRKHSGPKPPQPTLLTRSQGMWLLYLERKGIASFRGCNIAVAV